MPEVQWFNEVGKKQWAKTVDGQPLSDGVYMLPVGTHIIEYVDGSLTFFEVIAKDTFVPVYVQEGVKNIQKEIAIAKSSLGI